MKRFLLNTAVLSIAGMTFGSLPAHAGHWAVTFAGSCSGTNNNYVFANNGPGNSYPTQGTTLVFTSLIVGGSNLPQGETVANAYQNIRSAAGGMAVTATFTWTADSNAPTNPPSTVYVVESGFAETAGLDSGQGDSELSEACDGFVYTYPGFPNESFYDPCLYTNVNSGAPFRASQCMGQGSYITAVSVPSGTTSFTLPQRILALGVVPSVGPVLASPPVGQMNYTASVDGTADYAITVSPTSTPIGTPATATVTVQSINGFSGTVVLSLIGQPAGSVPALPASGTLYQQVLPYSTIDGSAEPIYNPTGYGSGQFGPTTYGPTDDQLYAGVTGTFSPTSVTVASGGSATTTLTLTSTAGATGTYPIEVQGVAGSAATRDGFSTLNLY